MAVSAVMLMAACSKSDETPVTPPGNGTESGDEIENGYVCGEANVLFSEDMTEEIESAAASGRLVTKSSELNGFIDIYGVESMTRLFPDAGEYEARSRREGLHRWYKVSYSKEKAVTKAVSDLSSLPGVEIAEPVMEIRSSSVFDDPLFARQWDMLNDGSINGKFKAGADINVVPVWENYTTGSNKVTVGVIDGGIDYTHPDLAANYAGGYNFVHDTTAIVPHDHGTHVAGTIAAINNNGTGVCGIAGGNAAEGIDGVRLLSCQIFQAREGSDYDDSADGAPAIKWAADHGANIINNSWGYSFWGYWQAAGMTIPESLKAAIDYFIKYAGCDADGKQKSDSPMKGGLVVFAAGNDGWDTDPIGKYDPVVSVGSIGPDYTRAYYSNFGEWVDICAPGGSYLYTGGEVLSTLPGGEYGYFQGTSMACPHVTGAAALILSYCGKQGFTAQELRKKLIGGARMGAVSAEYEIGDLLDVYASINYTGGGAPFTVDSLSASGRLNSIDVSLKVGADPDDGKTYRYIVLYSEDRGLFDGVNPDDLPDGMYSATFKVGNTEVGGDFTATLEELKFSTKYYVAVIGEDKIGNRSAMSDIAEVSTEANNPPVISTDYTGDYRVKANSTLRVAYSITEPDGHKFRVKTEAGSKAAAFKLQRDGSYILEIRGAGDEPGKYTASVTATDSYGAASTLTIGYELLENNPPVLTGDFGRHYSQTIGEKFSFNLGDYITDPDGDGLTWTAKSAEKGLSTLKISEDWVLTATVSGFGYNTVTVTGTDIFGKSVSGQIVIFSKSPYEYAESFPNPVIDNLTIRTGYDRSTKVSLYTESGAKVFDSRAVTGAFNPMTIEMAGWAPGRYLLRLEIDGEKTIERRITKI